MEAAWRRLCRDKATIIQCFARQYLSRQELARLREARRILERDMATRIQANARSTGRHQCLPRVLDEISSGATHSALPPLLAVGLCTRVLRCVVPPSSKFFHSRSFEALPAQFLARLTHARTHQRPTPPASVAPISPSGPNSNISTNPTGPLAGRLGSASPSRKNNVLGTPEASWRVCSWQPSEQLSRKREKQERNDRPRRTPCGRLPSGYRHTARTRTTPRGASGASRRGSTSR